MRPLDDEGEAAPSAVGGMVDLIVVVAAVPDEVAVRARPEGASLRAGPLAVVALSVPI